MSEKRQYNPECINSFLERGATFLADLQPSYERVVTEMRRKHGIHNRGCGPSSYGLAVLLQEKLDGLPIDATFSSDVDLTEGIHIVFGLQREGEWRDHTWLEVVLDDQALIVSPASSPTRAEASYRGTVVESKYLNDVYPAMGIKRLNNRDKLAMILTKEQWKEVGSVVNDINGGEVPANYDVWVSSLLSLR